MIKVSLWLAGVGISLCLLSVGLARLAWLASRSRRISRGMWAELIEEISRQYGLVNARLKREPMTRSARLLSLLVLSTLAILIAGLGASAQTAFATFSGAVSDPMGGVLPKVTLVLTNVQSQAKHEVRSDQVGHFEFVGLPPGEYLLEGHALGFATLQGTVTPAGQNKQQNIKLQIGSVSETINVTDFSTAALEAVRRWQFESTLLNCVPIAVNIKATINFRVAPPPPSPPPPPPR